MAAEHRCRLRRTQEGGEGFPDGPGCEGQGRGIDDAGLLARVTVASIGPITTEAAVRRGVRVDLTAESYTVPGLVAALERHYGELRREDPR